MARITSSNDAYGAELRSYLETGASVEIVERDDGYIDYHHGVSRYFDPYRAWTNGEKKAVKLAEGRVVDVGCGAGRVSLYLQQKGVTAVGLDNSPGAIEICKERGVRETVLTPFSQIDESVGRPDCFVMFGNNFGLFGSRSGAKRLLRKLASLSSDGALIIAQSTDPHPTDNPSHLSYHERNESAGRMPGQVRIRVRHRQFIGPWFDYLLVSREELESIVAGTAWKVDRYIEDGGPTYFVVLEKKSPTAK